MAAATTLPGALAQIADFQKTREPVTVEHTIEGETAEDGRPGEIVEVLIIRWSAAP